MVTDPTRAPVVLHVRLHDDLHRTFEYAGILGSLGQRHTLELRAEPEERRHRSAAHHKHRLVLQRVIRSIRGHGVRPVTDEAEAARTLGIDVRSNVCDLPLLNSRDLNRLRSNLQVRNAASSQDGSQGGFLVGESMVDRLETAMLSFGGMLQVSEIIRTERGDDLRWPTADDSSNEGEQLGESSETSTADPTFGRQTWSAYKFSSKLVRVPTELLTDSGVDFDSMLGNMLGERIGRILNSKFTTGSGASTPVGITTGLTVGATAASATAIVFDDLIELQHSIDPSRRDASASWMFHDNVLKLLRKLKTGDGEYIWQSGLLTHEPPTILGSKFTINQSMNSAVTTGLTTVIYGQMNQYKVRSVGSLRLVRLVERYGEFDEVGFIAWHRADGQLLDAGDSPVKALVQA